MINQWFIINGATALGVFLSTAGIYLAVIVAIRLAGLRALSQMSSFDFTMTLAVGSLIATTILSKDPPLLAAATAVASIFGLQFVVAKIRRTKRFARLLDNQPVLLMDGEEILHENLRKTRVTEHDLRAKLRAANVLQLRQVRAVVMETTGDISVLHGSTDGPQLDPVLLENVRDAHHLHHAAASTETSPSHAPEESAPA